MQMITKYVVWIWRFQTSCFYRLRLCSAILQILQWHFPSTNFAYHQAVTSASVLSKIVIFPQFVFHLFGPLACAECDDSLPFSGASSIPLCYVLFLATLLLQLFFHSLSLHLAIYFLVYLSILLFPNSYIIFWELYFLPFSWHTQTNVIYSL
jgi:hypothetical protein